MCRRELSMNMDINLHCFERAYINLPKTYDTSKSVLQNLNLMDLILAVAKANPNGDGDEQLYDMATHMFYAGRTKAYIVRKTKEYILGMSERFSPEENMANFVSLRQLKKLIIAFIRDKKRISGYSLIYIYVIYTLIKNKSSEASKCQTYLNALYIVIGEYFEDNPDDQLAEFFYGCYEPIIKAIKAGNIELHNEQLPPIPRNHPQDDD